MYSSSAVEIPNNSCNTGIRVAKENNDSIVDMTLKNTFNITYPLYGGTNLRSIDKIDILKG
jgi:hypothetical protein